MDLAFVLLYFELIGLTIAFLYVYISNRMDNRKTVFYIRKLICKKRVDDQWLIDYFQQHPKKIFKRNFPELYKIAYATNEYKKLNGLRKSGLVTEKEYQRRLEEILPLIDINLDLKGIICK